MTHITATENESLDNPLHWFPDIETAIEREPLVVGPNTPLVEVIGLISQAHNRCHLWEDTSVSESAAPASRHAGCVLVMEGSDLLGILTERDVVRLTAAETHLADIVVAAVMTSPVITIPEQSVQDIFAALFLLRRYRIRHLPVLDAVGSVVGVISHASLRQVLRPANLLRFRRVADVMSQNVIQAPLDTPVFRLAQLMAEHRVSCVVIVLPDEAGNARPVGIITERDVVQFQALQLNLGGIPAHELMSTPLFLLDPQDSLWKAQQEMQKRHVGRLVVSWNWGKSMGLVTQTSLLRVFDPMEMYGVIENLQQTIQQLKAEKSSVLTPPSRSPDVLALTAFNDEELPLLSAVPVETATIPASSSRENAQLIDLLSKTAESLGALIEQPQVAKPELRSRLIRCQKYLQDAVNLL